MRLLTATCLLSHEAMQFATDRTFSAWRWPLVDAGLATSASCLPLFWPLRACLLQRHHNRLPHRWEWSHRQLEENSRTGLEPGLGLPASDRALRHDMQHLLLMGQLLPGWTRGEGHEHGVNAGGHEHVRGGGLASPSLLRLQAARSSACFPR
jgi:hypothetical protein